MVIAEFERKDGWFEGFKVCGHADFAEFGHDIVCAAVSSALQLVVNGLTEILKLECKLEREEGCVALHFAHSGGEGYALAGQAFVEAFCLHLKLLAQEYRGTIEVKILEV